MKDVEGHDGIELRRGKRVLEAASVDHAIDTRPSNAVAGYDVRRHLAKEPGSGPYLQQTREAIARQFSQEAIVYVAVDLIQEPIGSNPFGVKCK